MKPWRMVESLSRAVHHRLAWGQRWQPWGSQTEQQCQMARVVLNIHRALQLDEVLTTTVTEVRQMLQADRVLIYQVQTGGRGKLVAESVAATWPSLLGQPLSSPWSSSQTEPPTHQNEGGAVPDPQRVGLRASLQEWLQQANAKTEWVVPIPQVDLGGHVAVEQPVHSGRRCGRESALPCTDGLPWGLLVIHQCDRPRRWQPNEQERLNQLIPHIAIAIQRGEACDQLQRDLEHHKQTEPLHREMAERRLVETLLKVSQARLQKLAANIPGVIYQYLRRPDGTDAIPYVSDGLRELCGLEPGVITRDSHQGWALVHPDDRANLQDTLLESGRSLQPWQQEFRVVTPSEQVKWVQAHARPELRADGSVLWDGLLIDVSDRKAAEVALRLSEARLQAILDNSRTIVYLRNLEGQHLLVNPAGEQLFQRAASQVIGKTLQEILPPEVAEVMQQHDDQVLATGSSLEFEEQVPHASGVRVYLSVKFPLLDSDGRAYAIGGIATDITERKRAELDVQKALEQEKELNQLKSRFIATASHEFRTPLTVITSSTGILNHYAAKLSTEQRQKHFERIQSAVNHMTQLLDHVLAINKAEANSLEFQPTAVDLVDFGRQVVEDMQAGHPDHTLVFQAVEVPTNSDPPQLWGQFDRQRLWQIFTHLIANAIQYSSPGSPVDITLSQRGDRAVISVQDYGIGIPLIDQPRLFEAFHRASNVGVIPGTGLGLTLVKKCIDLHGGEITVTSQVNQGTLVVVDMPLNSTAT